MAHRVFSHNPNTAGARYYNPILMAGDIVRVRDSAVSVGICLLNEEVATPFIGIYGFYSTEMGQGGERFESLDMLLKPLPVKTATTPETAMANEGITSWP